MKGRLVIDIGSGSGLLALMASKLGAEQVIAIEVLLSGLDLMP